MGAEEAEVQNGAAGDARQHIDPQLPVSGLQHEGDDTGPGEKTEEAVQRRADPPAPAARHTQKVKHHAQQGAQHPGQEEGCQLLGEIHPHQPNRRPSSPPLP